jgi:hypothetical protein
MFNAEDFFHRSRPLPEFRQMRYITLPGSAPSGGL